jgi:hypothetical protein
MLLVLLGMSVFFWGLGYKLSQYESQTSHIRRIPEAKLMSRNEDRSATDVVQLCLTKAELLQKGHVYTFILALTLFSISGVRTSFGRHYLALPKPWCQQPCAFQSAFFLRPPPALVSL